METIIEGSLTSYGSSIINCSNTRDDEIIHQASEEEMEMQLELRRGPWTSEEDNLLIHFVNKHGEGRWNSLARAAGLKRTGKSCRLRWLNYLRPDVRRGNITPQEQLLILHLHLRWGNRWSKIAQYLPGRTDNEIKNYWRTRVQKHAKQLQCDVNSKKFKDVMHYIWMPYLLQRIQATASTSTTTATPTDDHQKPRQDMMISASNKAPDESIHSQVQINSSPSKSDCFTDSVNSTVSAKDPQAEFSSNSDVFQCMNTWTSFANGNDPAGLLDSQQSVNWGVDFTDSMWNLDDILSVQ